MVWNTTAFMKKWRADCSPRWRVYCHAQEFLCRSADYPCGKISTNIHVISYGIDLLRVPNSIMDKAINNINNIAAAACAAPTQQVPPAPGKGIAIVDNSVNISLQWIVFDSIVIRNQKDLRPLTTLLIWRTGIWGTLHCQWQTLHFWHLSHPTLAQIDSLGPGLQANQWTPNIY